MGLDILSVGKPVVGKPVVGKPVVGKPVVGKPVVGKPVVGKPVITFMKSSFSFFEGSYVPPCNLCLWRFKLTGSKRMVASNNMII
jgi:hypothetical protein